MCMGACAPASTFKVGHPSGVTVGHHSWCSISQSKATRSVDRRCVGGEPVFDLGRLVSTSLGVDLGWCRPRVCAEARQLAGSQLDVLKFHHTGSVVWPVRIVSLGVRGAVCGEVPGGEGRQSGLERSRRKRRGSTHTGSVPDVFVCPVNKRHLRCPVNKRLVLPKSPEDTRSCEDGSWC
jgi:hypothetical protein